MHQNSTNCTKTKVESPMGWIECIRWEKFWRDFVARTFALVKPVFHRVLRANQTVPNAPKYYETRQNMSLGSHGVDRVRSLQKVPMRLRGMTFWTSLTRFALSLVRQPKGPKCTRIVRNTPKCEFRVQWGGSGALVAKNSDSMSWHELLHQLCPVLHRVL